SVVRTFHLVDDDSQQERTKGITRVAGIAVLNCAVSNKVGRNRRQVEKAGVVLGGQLVNSVGSKRIDKVILCFA
ncbi:hypothetical protein J6590_098794, partial [Homalodisca vitripennis]